MKNKYYGWEFKPALTAAIHKMASDLGMSKVDVTFRSDIPTAAINRQGRIFIQNIKDDAILNRSDLEQFTGYAMHELLHWKYTNFGVMEQSNIKYLIQLHNGIEDAWIENRAIANKLTGNVAQLLGSLIDRMAAEGLREVTDWSDPRQYPFALAVYARKHSTIKVPLADGLQPLFDQACLRLNNCQSTADTWVIAEWLFNELCKFQPPEPPTNPQPPTNPDTNPTDSEPPQEGGNQDGPTKGEKPPTSPDQEGDKGDAPSNDKDAPVGKAKSPVKQVKKNEKGQTVKVIVKARSVEPEIKVPEGAKSGGSTGEWAVTAPLYHTRPDAGVRWKINF